jgi:apolipoprotein D and lipocalin family protein
VKRFLPLIPAITTLIFLAFLLAGCTGIPKGVAPVNDFDPQRYLGTWYEVARLDHSFEKGLDNTSATYTARDDGGIDVVNRGYDRARGKWKQAAGRAYFISGRSAGRLKVAFFRPFYGAYNIIKLDEERYSYSLVCGPNRKYLWILSRTPGLDRQVLDGLVEYARDKGFPTESLVFPAHDLAGP